MATFPASIFRVTTDSEGESKITLVVPADSLDRVLPLATLSGRLLSVSVEIDPSDAS